MYTSKRVENEIKWFPKLDDFLLYAVDVAVWDRHEAESLPFSVWLSVTDAQRQFIVQIGNVHPRAEC